MNRTQVGAAPGPAQIRPASHTDRGALRDFLTGLSPRTSYLRFFMGGSPAGPAMLAVLTGSRPDTDAVVAVCGDVIVGHAMAVCIPGPGAATAADIGVVVTDAWQGRGVGAALLRAVAALAWARGATTLQMDVLAENQRVLGMINGHWPGAPRSRSGPYVAVSAPLPAPVFTHRGCEEPGNRELRAESHSSLSLLSCDNSKINVGAADGCEEPGTRRARTKWYTPPALCGADNSKINVEDEHGCGEPVKRFAWLPQPRETCPGETVPAPVPGGIPAPGAAPGAAPVSVLPAGGCGPADDFPGSGPSYLPGAHSVAG